MKCAILVLVGLLIIIPGINALPGAGTSLTQTGDAIGNQTVVVKASTTNEEFMPTPPLRITISGKITTPDGHPIDGATVQTEFFMTYDTKTVTVKSEADGSYRINNAHGFNQKISVEKNGYINVTKEMRFNKNVNTVDFTLEPATQPASGFTAVLCLVAILGSVLIIIFRKERT